MLLYCQCCIVVIVTLLLITFSIHDDVMVCSIIAIAVLISIVVDITFMTIADNIIRPS